MIPDNSNRNRLLLTEISRSPFSASEEQSCHLYDARAREDLEIVDLKAGYSPGLLAETAEASDAIFDTSVSVPPMSGCLLSDLAIQPGESSSYSVASTGANSEDLEDSDETEGQEFWNSQRLNPENSQKLWEAFRKVLLYGPNRKLPGVRVHPDLASKEDNPNTPFCIIDQITPGALISMELSLATVWLDRFQTWRIWAVIYEHLRESWLKGMSIAKKNWSEMVPRYNTSVSEHPGHFTENWAFFEGDSVTVEELSFTRFGFPSSEFRRCMKSDGSTTEIWSKAGKHVARTPNSRQEASISGRSWTICPGSQTMPWSSLALSSSQVILGHDLNTVKVAECAIVFPKRYAGPWPTTPWTNWCCRNAITDSDSKRKYSGLYFERDRWRIFGESTEYSIVETRSSIAILTSLWHQLPYYSMVTLTDTPGFSLDYIENQMTWSDVGLSPCHEFAGVTIFQLAVRRLITEWGEQWNSTLKLITSMSRVQIDGILDPVQRRDLRSSDAEAQERPFTARELLLKSYDMIGELARDLRSLTKDLNTSTTVIALNSVGMNCEKLITYQQGIESRLLDLIERKLVEIDSSDAFHTLPPRSPGVYISSLCWGLLTFLILLAISWSWRDRPLYGCCE
ncbi:uncharacterized protein PAC_10558 [Phialocephala subalpina]|uniref:Uncharacterized protein n=1 Tax=Phialocephala subalpina TaxID=576137 RepID=A0A1L7X6N1_9HELO|nr:uncharacterized protein PAC_10558 [Phialocephala subalpina]